MTAPENVLAFVTTKLEESGVLARRGHRGSFQATFVDLIR